MSIVERRVESPADGPLLINAEELARLLNTSERSIWRYVSAGDIPKPVRLGRGTVRWRYEEIREWIAAGCPKPDARENGRLRR
jgi:predicted DNA-binding transcriptional regulator AlpA